VNMWNALPCWCTVLVPNWIAIVCTQLGSWDTVMLTAWCSNLAEQRVAFRTGRAGSVHLRQWSRGKGLWYASTTGGGYRGSKMGGNAHQMSDGEGQQVNQPADAVQ
jgi:hypothetical protein